MVHAYTYMHGAWLNDKLRQAIRSALALLAAMAWQWNGSWGPEHMRGWLYVQGRWDWGATLTWHVESDSYDDVWVCYCWWMNYDIPHIGQSWNHVLVRELPILTAFDDCWIRHWMVHDIGSTRSLSALLDR